MHHVGPMATASFPGSRVGSGATFGHLELHNNCCVQRTTLSVRRVYLWSSKALIDVVKLVDLNLFEPMEMYIISSCE